MNIALQSPLETGPASVHGQSNLPENCNGSAQKPKDGQSVGVRLQQLRLQVAPTIGRTFASANHCMTTAGAKGIALVERLMAPRNAGEQPLLDQDSRKSIDQRRAKAMSIIGLVSKVTDLGTLASAVASMFTPAAMVATLAFALVTFALRKVNSAIAHLALKSLQQQEPEKNLPPQWCLKATQLMKQTGTKYLPTQMGLMTRTDLALYAHSQLENAARQNQVAEKDKPAFKALQEFAEATLRGILAGKANKRDVQAQLGLAPIVKSDARVSANQVGAKFGQVGKQHLLPLTSKAQASYEAKESSDSRSVIKALCGSDYGSQTARPALEYTLRNLSWQKVKNPADWIHLLQDRKAIMAQEKATGQKFNLSPSADALINKSGIEKTQIDTLLQEPLSVIAINALDALPENDKTQFNVKNFSKMSPAGQGVIYAVQTLIRQNANLQSPEAFQALSQKSLTELKSSLKTLPGL